MLKKARFVGMLRQKTASPHGESGLAKRGLGWLGSVLDQLQISVEDLDQGMSDVG